MARALVIGGTLFIGRALVEQLLEQGDEVTIMHRSAGTPFGERVGEIRCDRNDARAVRAALEGRAFDIVYDNVYDFVRGTSADAVRAAAEAAGGVRRYVFTSSVAAYAPGGDGELEEHDPLAPPDHPDTYARDKAESERALFTLWRERGLPVTTLRPAFVYGAHNPLDRETFFWDRILADRPIIIPGDGQRTLQLVHAGDVARTAARAAEQDVAIGHAYNLGSPPVTQVELVELLARVAGRPARLVHVPRARIDAAGGGIFSPPFYFGVYLDLPTMTMSGARVRRELGVELIPLEDGLRETFEWYLRQPRPRPDYTWEDRLIANAV